MLCYHPFPFFTLRLRRYRTMLRLVTLSLALGLAACGMKGPLELPPRASAATTAKPAIQGGDGSTPASPSSSASKDTQP